MACRWLKLKNLVVRLLAIVTCLALGVGIGLLVTGAAKSQRANPFIRPSCSLIHIIRVWEGPLRFDQDTMYVGQLHVYLHERYDFVLEIRPMIPKWPDALLCTLPPVQGGDSVAHTARLWD